MPVLVQPKQGAPLSHSKLPLPPTLYDDGRLICCSSAQYIFLPKKDADFEMEANFLSWLLLGVSREENIELFEAYLLHSSSTHMNGQ